MMMEGSERFVAEKPKRFSCHSTFACALLARVLRSTLVGARKPSGRCTARQAVPTQWGNPHCGNGPAGRVSYSASGVKWRSGLENR